MEIMSFRIPAWLACLSLSIGLTVGWLAYRVSGLLIAARRRRLPVGEEDLPWEDLLEMLKGHRRDQDGDVAFDDIPAEELLKMFLQKSAAGRPAPQKPELAVEEACYLQKGAERRRSRRRWANPIEVHLTSAFHEKPLGGVVINRSTGGLAILTDTQFAPDAALFVRPLEAPKGLPSIEVIVRHARPVAKLWLIGCQYKTDLPWNVKVWFG